MDLSVLHSLITHQSTSRLSFLFLLLLLCIVFGSLQTNTLFSCNNNNSIWFNFDCLNKCFGTDSRFSHFEWRMKRFCAISFHDYASHQNEKWYHHHRTIVKNVRKEKNQAEMFGKNRQKNPFYWIWNDFIIFSPRQKETHESNRNTQCYLSQIVTWIK